MGATANKGKSSGSTKEGLYRVTSCECTSLELKRQRLNS